MKRRHSSLTTKNAELNLSKTQKCINCNKPITYVTTSPGTSQREYLKWYNQRCVINSDLNVSSASGHRSRNSQPQYNVRQNTNFVGLHREFNFRNYRHSAGGNSIKNSRSGLDYTGHHSYAATRPEVRREVRRPVQTQGPKSTNPSLCRTTGHPRLLQNQEVTKRSIGTQQSSRKRPLRPSNTTYNWFACPKNGPSDVRETKYRERVAQQNSEKLKPVFPKVENSKEWKNEENWDDDFLVIHVKQRTLGVQVSTAQLDTASQSFPSPITDPHNNTAKDTDSVLSGSGGEKAESTCETRCESPKDTVGPTGPTEDSDHNSSVSVDYEVTINRLNQLTLGIQELRWKYEEACKEREDLLNSLSEKQFCSTEPNIT